MTNRPQGRRRTNSGGNAARRRYAEQQPAPPAEEEKVSGPLNIPAAVTIHDLAILMDVNPIEVIKEFMRNGFMYTINEVVEYEIAAVVANTLGFEVLPLAEEGKTGGSIVISSDDEDPSLLEPRPPVVTILGHVDHGKTTLLDSLRNSNIVAGEAGGITQHIGAYQVDFEGTRITFLDTPGHEAFTAMRARGAQATDIAILVVAADDGIMPQTIEAIDHAKAAGVPIVVAINKVDKPDADPERVKRQLAEQDLLIEEWGGDVVSVPVSALKGDGISDLLENIKVVAEVAELKANSHREAKGVVIEARIDKSRGTVATILVQTGTLRIGDNIVVGAVKGRVKAMFTDRGKRIKKAGPSDPVELLGIDGLPQAGDILVGVADEKTARQMVEERQRERDRQRGTGPTLEDVYSRMELGEIKTLNLIVKTDVQGTIDPVKSALEQLNSDQSKVTIIHAASGSITESDILLAVASKAIVVGFNSRIEPGARMLANQEGVEIRFYSIIYNLVDDVELALKGLLEPVYRDIVEGRATVRAIFNVGRRIRVAGFYINDGRIARDSTIHVLKDGVEVYVGQISSLKHFKDDVREVTTGFEGGLSLVGYNEYQEGDILEAHRSERES
ncbi:MAG: translation initiation factor IF-2 [Chloroflexi bacterium]|nr:translation initiation factor IF-2 [Chloroflexota bacterium]